MASSASMPLPPGVSAGSGELIAPIQAGRALAALGVTAFHLSIMMGEARYGGEVVLGRWTALGKLGVDFFFVLSGFILMHVHRQDIGRPAAWGGFLWRRAVRVYPVYWVYLSVFIAMVSSGLGQAASTPLNWRDWLSAYSLLRFSAADTPLYVAWTLFHELVFYGLFGILILSRFWGWVALAAWALLCLSQFHYPGQGLPDAWGTYTSLANLYFLLGMAAHEAWRRRWTGLAVLMLGLAMFLVPPMTDSEQTGWGPMAMAIGCAMVLAGACQLDQDRRFRWPRSLLALGDASYSLYLLHLPLSGLLLKAILASGLRDRLGGAAAYALTLSLTAALAWLAYRAVEAPLLRGLRKWGPRRSAALPFSRGSVSNVLPG